MPPPHGFSGPLYEQVHDVLRQRVLSGEWALGVPLPGELHLCKEFGVSVGTVRKAMDKLSSERLIVRQRGRGTFVSRDPRHTDEPQIVLRDGNGKAIKPDITLREVSTRPPTRAERQALRCRRRGLHPPLVASLQRIWTCEGRLVCKETITVDALLIPLRAADIPAGSETLFEFYSEAYGLAVARVRWLITPPAPVADPAQVMLVRTGYDRSGTAIEICEQSLHLGGVSYQLQNVDL